MTSIDDKLSARHRLQRMPHELKQVRAAIDRTVTDICVQI
jgi:hypothetical protein